MTMLLYLFLISDTLSTAYGEKWQANQQLEQDSAIIQWLASNELIYVVGVVSLIIWLGILFFLIRIEKRLTKLESQ